MKKRDKMLNLTSDYKLAPPRTNLHCCSWVSGSLETKQHCSKV